MQLSETVKIYPTEYQKNLITQTMTEYIDIVNRLVFDAVNGHSIAKTTTADVSLIFQVHLKINVFVMLNPL